MVKGESMEDIFFDAVSVFPDRIKLPVINAYKNSPEIYEIRLIAGCSVYFYTRGGIRFVYNSGENKAVYADSVLKPCEDELEEIVNRAMVYSGFLYDKELKEGFITYARACRMGICTSGGGKCFGLGNINSLAIRLPYLDEGISNKKAEDLLLMCKKGLLIAGAPASGKTTLLRQLAKKLSDGVLGEYKKVTVIDERGEISAGSSLGACTDVLKGKAKSSAILHALRLLSPQYIICDEIGNVDETKALLEGLNAGVSFVASIHASDLTELLHRYQFRLLFSENVFGAVVFLSSENPGELKKIYSAEEIRNEISGTCGNMFCDSSDRYLSYVGS